MSDSQNSRDIEPLFETQTEYTYEKYARFCRVVQDRIGNIKRLVIKLEILMILIAVIFICLEEIKLSILFIITALIFPVLIRINIKKRTKKSWDSNKAAQGIVSHIRFYEDHIEQENTIGVSRLEYDKLFDVLETDEEFYLMIADNQGFIVDKQGCSEELCGFIRRYKKQDKNGG